MILDEEKILWWNDYHSLLLKKKAYIALLKVMKHYVILSEKLVP